VEAAVFLHELFRCQTSCRHQAHVALQPDALPIELLRSMKNSVEFSEAEKLTTRRDSVNPERASIRSLTLTLDDRRERVSVNAVRTAAVMTDHLCAAIFQQHSF